MPSRPCAIIVHLTAPGLDVIGMGEPAVPGITMGHNGTAAFGLTIFGADQEDVLVYETSGESYRYGDAWEPMRDSAGALRREGLLPTRS